MRISQFRLWLLVVAVLSLVSISQGSVDVSTTASVGPPPTSLSYANGGYTGTVLSALSRGIGPGSYPADFPFFYPLAPANLPWGAVTVDNSGQSVWLGNVITDTSSPFYGEKGTAFYVNAMFVGDGVHKFSADNIDYLVTSGDLAHSLNASGSLAGLTYGLDPIIGVDYGPDGLIHTADDIVYNSRNQAPGSAPVDWIIYAGVAVAYDATNVGLGYVQNYVNSVGPFDLTIAYTINDGTGDYSSFQTRTVVPEPASLTLLLGGGLLAFIRRRSAKR